MAKKKEESPANGEGVSLSYEKLVLDYPTTRYPLIRQAADWAMVLRRRQDYQHLKKNELLEQALADVLAKKVTPASIAKELEAMHKTLEEKAEAEAQQAKAKLKIKTKENGDEEKPKKEAAAKKKEKAKA